MIRRFERFRCCPYSAVIFSGICFIGALFVWTILPVSAATAPANTISIEGHVYDRGGKALNKVMVTVVFANGNPHRALTGGDGKYLIGPIIPPGKILRIEYTKQSVGHKEYYDLAERHDLKISVILGASPIGFAEVSSHLAELDRFFLRARFDAENLSLEAKDYLKSDALTKELESLEGSLGSTQINARLILQEKLKSLVSQRQALIKS